MEPSSIEKLQNSKPNLIEWNDEKSIIAVYTNHMKDADKYQCKPQSVKNEKFKVF